MAESAHLLVTRIFLLYTVQKRVIGLSRYNHEARMHILLLGRKNIAKAEDIVAALRRLGHETDFLLFPGFHYAGAEESYATSWGDISIPAARSRKGYYISHLFRILLMLRKRFHERQPETLFAIDWFEGLILLCYRYLFARRARVIFYSYDYYFYDSMFSSRYLINRIDRFVAAHADEVWNVTENIGLERAKHGDRTKLEKTVPLGIAHKTDLWEVKPSKHFLFVGNFKEGHNLPRLIAVFTELRKTDATYELTLVGKGNLETTIRELIARYGLEGGVHLRGFVAEADLLAEIRTGTYIASVAVYEPTQAIICADPGKIKDYLSWGLPVVTTDIHAAATDIRQYELGLVVESDDVETLANAFRSVDIVSARRWQHNIFMYTEQRSWERILREEICLS